MEVKEMDSTQMIRKRNIPIVGDRSSKLSSVKRSNKLLFPTPARCHTLAQNVSAVESIILLS